VHQARLPELKRVVYVRGKADTAPDGIARPIDEWLTGAAEADLAAASAVRVPPGAMAAIVYTSGTTGRPKGVMLSHRNVVSNVFAILEATQIRDDDVFLSFLPLSHTLERTAGYYLPILAGAAVAFARSVPLLMADLQTVRPTFLISVPRIYERAHGALRDAVGTQWVRRALLWLTVTLGWRRLEYAQHRASRPSLLARGVWPLLDAYVAAPVRVGFGGRIRAAVAGGAPLPAAVARPFLSLGLPLLQGYGLTESSPVIACNTPEDNDPGTVGHPLPGVEVRIGDRDELQVRGDNVMLGYWRRPEETASVLEPSGWLHTGDQTVLESGRIRIKGRIKDIIVTSTGEKIAPADLEAAILEDSMFEQAMVVGEQRPFLVALLVLSEARWREAVRGLGLDPDPASSLNSAVARQWAIKRIRDAVRAFPSYATPRAVFLTLDPWTIANGLITPTLKPKRLAIEARYAKDIQALYAGHA